MPLSVGVVADICCNRVSCVASVNIVVVTMCGSLSLSMSAERAVSSREEGLHERTSHDRRRHNADGLSDLCRARLCVCVCICCIYCPLSSNVQASVGVLRRRLCERIN